MTESGPSLPRLRVRDHVRLSSLGTVAVEELRKAYGTPQVYQFYFHRDRSLNRAMLQRAKTAGVNVMMLTVDSITGEQRTRSAHRILHSLQADAWWHA